MAVAKDFELFGISLYDDGLTIAQKIDQRFRKKFGPCGFYLDMYNRFEFICADGHKSIHDIEPAYIMAHSTIYFEDRTVTLEDKLEHIYTINIKCKVYEACGEHNVENVKEMLEKRWDISFVSTGSNIRPYVFNYEGLHAGKPLKLKIYIRESGLMLIRNLTKPKPEPPKPSQPNFD